MLYFKFISFIIYSLAVTLFIFYINILYVYNVYKDWLIYDFKNMSTFDYIVVGAGSAGSILASQLSNGGAKVLLLEAGGVPINFFDIPMVSPLLTNSPYDWKYKTISQKNGCKGLHNNQSIWSAGKILGGSSRINYMIYMQGHPRDYDSWFPDFEDLNFRKTKSLHVNNQNWHSKLSNAILQGVNELLYPLRNVNQVPLTGFMRVDLTIDNGERWSADKVFHQNVIKRLNILTNSLVTKVLFQSKKAVGVEFWKYNKIYQAFANKGVILSAGAIGTPKILMLSGVGPKQHLKEVNIKNIVDLPVGQHLIDHIITGLDLVTINSTDALSIADILNPYSMLKYYLYGTGPWTSSVVEVVGTFHSKLQKNKSMSPDIQIMTFPFGLSQDNGFFLRKNFGISDKVFKEYFAPLSYQTATTIAPVLLHPKSLGEIKLKSSDPSDDPIIDPKYLSKEEDVLTLIEGIQFIKKLIKTKAMVKLGARLYEKPFPGCESFVFDSIEYWKCYINHLTLTTYHPGGTCRMGSVVNSKFRVKKTTNLYVVDASVLPTLPSGNIQGPVLMLSEKAARLIIQDFHKDFVKMSICYKSDIFLL